MITTKKNWLFVSCSLTKFTLNTLGAIEEIDFNIIFLYSIDGT